MKRCFSFSGRIGSGLGLIAGFLSMSGAPLEAASPDRRELRAFRGTYRGWWQTDGQRVPLQVRIGSRIRGSTPGRFEATPSDPDDGLSPPRGEGDALSTIRKREKTHDAGEGDRQRSRNLRIGGPDSSGPLRMTSRRRVRSPLLRGRMTAGAKRGSIKAEKGGAMPSVPVPWMEMVWVGNPGNALDEGNPNPGGDAYIGSVANDFLIGKYEVTNGQYAEFLNAVAKSDPGMLYEEKMGTDLRGGINRSGASGNYVYTALAFMGDKPVNFVNFWNACRFCNWLHHRRPRGDQGENTTENGAYDLTDADAISNNTVFRNAGARYFLPLEEERYKAAYHDPRSAAEGGPEEDDNFWKYPTRSDSVPDRATADNSGSINNDSDNIANYFSGADWFGQDGHVTTVGSGGPGSASFYGAFDMGGNVGEWSETKAGTGTVTTGGSFGSPDSLLSSFLRGLATPDSEFAATGFRVAAP